MTIGNGPNPSRAAERGTEARPGPGRASAIAMALAPLLVAVGFRVDEWIQAALGWLGVALLAAAALTAHQLRSAFPDEMSGRRTVVIRLGDVGARVLYVGLVVAAYTVLVGLSGLAPWALIALTTVLPLGFPVWRVCSGAVSRQLDPVARHTALVCLQYGALVGVTLTLSAT